MWATMGRSPTTEVALAEPAASDVWGQCHQLLEWASGPLVSEMENGDLFLLDETSLAEDAVLERLNLVPERGRSLTVAEHEGEMIVAPPP